MPRKKRPVLATLSLIFLLATLWLLFVSFRPEYRTRIGFSATRTYQFHVTRGIACFSILTLGDFADVEAVMKGTAPIRVDTIIPAADPPRLFWSWNDGYDPETTLGFACSNGIRTSQQVGFFSGTQSFLAFPLALALLLSAILPVRWLWLMLRHPSGRPFEVILNTNPPPLNRK